jgi:hypothetical protein
VAVVCGRDYSRVCRRIDGEKRRLLRDESIEIGKKGSKESSDGGVVRRKSGSRVPALQSGSGVPEM